MLFMQHRLIHIRESGKAMAHRPVVNLSFKPFIDYIKDRMNDAGSIKKDIYELILQKFQQFPELEGNVPIEDTAKYKELFNLLYVVLSTVVEDEKKILWGISLPVSPVLFYGSDALFEFLQQPDTGDPDTGFFSNKDTLHRQKSEMLYGYLLEHFYNFNFSQKTEIIRPIRDRTTGMFKYYRINLDTRFVKVTPTRPLPELNLENLQIHLYEEAGLELLERILPLDMFEFSGFSIITITDVTPFYALETIRNLLVNSKEEQSEKTHDEVVTALKAMADTHAVDFHLLPLFRVNGKLVQDTDAYSHSIIFSLGKQEGVMKNFFLPMIEKFLSSPRIIYFRDLETSGPSQQQIGELLKVAGLKSYALMPVYYNKELVGAFEIYSRQRGLLDEKVFARIEPAMPLIAQLMYNAVEDFNRQIDAVIRGKFTSIQPAVQWKFNEAAWNFLYKTRMQEKQPDIEKIEFRNVYPLYGAIDMRNSTLERNQALLNDLRYQFAQLEKLLGKLKPASRLHLTDEFIYKCNWWQQQANEGLTTNDEIRLNQFLNEQAHPFLKHFRDISPDMAPDIESYFEDIQPPSGKAWQHRRQLEDSMQLINNAVNNYLDMVNMELQQAHPCYFEKFRTDGVEYDIYIGQSITPDKPFDLIYLKNLRLWQLASMAAIAKLSNHLLPQMKVPLQTTQLIFIYANTIDISFRNDERRFDVEGGYNIRYHVIKKRIDKVHLKGSNERLTQPGKIALVYFNQKDADEYVSYIRHLQDKKILLDDLEYLDLEELQGVSGLKALRVGVDLSTEAENMPI